MYLCLRIKQKLRFLLLLCSLGVCLIGFANGVNLKTATIDRIQLVTEQVNLLKNRLNQASNELIALQQQHDKTWSQLSVDNITQSLTNKTALDIAVSSSNLDGINMELTDSQQNISWLEKNIQEIKNQLSVIAVFGVKMAANELTNTHTLTSDLEYQKHLLQLEKAREKYLQQLQTVAGNILALQKDNSSKLTTSLKSRRLLMLKQQQVKDELAYQEKQNYWLQQLNGLYAQLATVDPSKDQSVYNNLERDIFYANENANFAYTQSLIARYKDQIQQMRFAITKNNSISLLNEMHSQTQILTRQIDRLTEILKSRHDILANRILFFAQNQKNDDQTNNYLGELKSLETQYEALNLAITTLNKNIYGFRLNLDQALKTELSSRQGLSTLNVKTLWDVGADILLVPTLAFQVLRSLTSVLSGALEALSKIDWVLLLSAQILLVMSGFIFRKRLARFLSQPAVWHHQINLRWFGLRWLQCHLWDILICSNIVACLFFLDIPSANAVFVIYFLFIWLSAKSILTILRVCLVEAAHETDGNDIRLYSRLKWFIIFGGIIVSLTMFMHLLPMLYELKMVCDQFFLLVIMVISLYLLRYWQVIPGLILSQFDLTGHPYIRKSIRFIGIVVPLLMLFNAVMGLLGFLNFIITISKYEGIFLFVLSLYLILRGFLVVGIQALSRLIIQYMDHGWLLVEAFLKPIARVLRMILFLSGWTALFLLSGIDKQSPLFVRLMRLLHYQLFNVLNTSITPMNILELLLVVSVFYWIAKWTREFVYRLLQSRTNDMGIRNTIAILSQYSVVVLGVFISLKVLGISLQALTVVFGMFAFGVGLGLRDLVNNFACGLLILLERPLRVGDIVSVNNAEGMVSHIGGRAVTIRTWDHIELVVPNTEIFNKSFVNMTANDNTVRAIALVKVSREDNPHEVRELIHAELVNHQEILEKPIPRVFLKDLNETFMLFELRFFVNIRQVHSRTSVISSILMKLWDTFAAHGIKLPSPQYEVFLREGQVSFKKTIKDEVPAEIL